MPSAKRISREDFTALLKNPYKTVFNALGTLKYVKNSTEDLIQKGFSVVVSSKHEKKAVSRNKLRRRLRATFDQSPVSVTAIFYVSKQSYTMEYSEIKTIFNELLNKIS